MRRANISRAQDEPGAEPSKVELVASMDVTSVEELRARSIAIALMFAALFCFACLDTSGKWLSRQIPIWEVVWARYMGATLFVLIFINPAFDLAAGPAAHPRAAFVRRDRPQFIRSALVAACRDGVDLIRGPASDRTLCGSDSR